MTFQICDEELKTPPIGEGKYSKVYKLKRNGRAFAVKKLKRQQTSSSHLQIILRELTIL